jgi:6-phosphofructo-2-kinase/fructose-2,6-biphosphatase 4
MINAGQRYEVNNCRFGYLPNRIVFYLMNLHIKSRKTYFARAGISGFDTTYKADAPLSEQGRAYSERLREALIKHREDEHSQFLSQGGNANEIRSLAIWTSTRVRTVQTAEPLQREGYAVREKTQLAQLNPGDSEKHTDEELRKIMPSHWEEHMLDPYHHRYPRGESYHDLAVRLEPIILELEREKQDLLIIAHESVLRVLYGYLMACSTVDIPALMFPRNEIVEVNSRAPQGPGNQ